MDDFELAQKLHRELNTVQEFHYLHRRNTTSLVDESWEYLDPNPDARSLFLEFNATFFWGKLDGVEVRWSPRMTMCAGLCCYEGRGGLCSIRLSKPLLTLRPRKDLVETLLHEMIHAYLFVTQNNKDHDAHGPEFHKHMYRINKIAGTNISVYHNFHDEVAHYKQHWWKCDGPCQKWPPYHGLVKRAMNRAPSSNDFWWADHQKKCGGTYHKIKEPEGYGQKKSKKSKTEKSEKSPKPSGCQDIRQIFGGVGPSARNKNQSIHSLPTIGKKPPPPLPDINLMQNNGSTDNKWTVNTINTIDSSGGEDNVMQSENGEPCNFPGPGKSLNVNGMTQENRRTGPIVRKLPGIGIITNERPVLSNNAASENKDNYDGNNDDNPDEDIILYSPDTERDKNAFSVQRSLETLGRHDTSNHSERVWNASKEVDYCDKNNFSCDRRSPVFSIEHSVETLPTSHSVSSPQANEDSVKGVKSRKRTSIIEIDSDSDKEFDSLLNSMKKRRRIQRNINKGSAVADLRNNDSDTGSCQRITNFMSVCNPKSPEFIKKKNDSEVKNSENFQNRSYKRGEKVTEFAINRNKRAHDLLFSDSDEDDDTPSISKAMKKKNQRRTDEWLRLQKYKNLHDMNSISAPTISNPSNSQRSDGDTDHFSTSSAFENSSRDKTANQNIERDHSVQNNETPDSAVNDDVALVDCPVCAIKVPAIAVNEHLDACLSMA